MTFASPKLGLLAVFISLCISAWMLSQRYNQRKRLARWGAATQAIVPPHEPIRQALRTFCLMIAIVSFDLAIARPQWGFYLEKIPHRGVTMLFALDTSKSMLANDVRPNRLELAKMSILDLSKTLKDSQVGLIAFAGSAFLQCPPTTDFGAFKASLQAINTDTIQHGGTNLSAPLLLAQKCFNPQAQYKHLMLITDGEDLSGTVGHAIEVLKKAGIVVHTIGIGTTQGGSILIDAPNGTQIYKKDDRGNTLITHLDEQTLKTIASTTGGFYAPLGNAGDGLQHIYDLAIKQLPKENFESIEQKPIERYRGFLWATFILLAVEPLLYVLRKRKHA